MCPSIQGISFFLDSLHILIISNEYNRCQEVSAPPESRGLLLELTGQSQKVSRMNHDILSSAEVRVVITVIYMLYSFQSPFYSLGLPWWLGQ